MSPTYSNLHLLQTFQNYLFKKYTKLEKCLYTANMEISQFFLTLRFYVKLILGIVKVQKLPFLQILESLNFDCDGHFHILLADIY